MYLSPRDRFWGQRDHVQNTKGYVGPRKRGVPERGAEGSQRRGRTELGGTEETPGKKAVSETTRKDTGERRRMPPVPVERLGSRAPWPSVEFHQQYNLGHEA